MVFDKRMLYYGCLSAFNKIYYKDLLTKAHYTGKHVKLDKIHYPNGAEEERANFWGYVFIKDGISYLVSAFDSDGEEVYVPALLPILPSNIQKVAHQGSVYTKVEEWHPAKFKQINVYGFKQLIKNLSSLQHSNHQLQVLNCIIDVAQMIDRINIRKCSPPSFGKDSTVDILGNLMGNAATIENPTIAKLEYMTFYKLLAINEAVDIAPAEWRHIEQFLLATGAFKPEVTKHSRATKGVQEVLKVDQLSLTVMYNDIDCYKTGDEYIDFIAKKAVKDRFPPVRFHGTYTEDFNVMKTLDFDVFVKEHMQDYKDMIYTFEYYKVNWRKHVHGFTVNETLSKFMDSKPDRWKQNIYSIVKFIDVFSVSQEEFNMWCNLLKGAMQDYEDMLSYYISGKRPKNEKYIKELNTELVNKTFTERLQMLREGAKVKPVTKGDFNVS